MKHLIVLPSGKILDISEILHTSTWDDDIVVIFKNDKDTLIGREDHKYLVRFIETTKDNDYLDSLSAAIK